MEDASHLIWFFEVQSVASPLYHDNVSLGDPRKHVNVKIGVTQDFPLKRLSAIQHQARAAIC